MHAGTNAPLLQSAPVGQGAQLSRGLAWPGFDGGLMRYWPTWHPEKGNHSKQLRPNAPRRTLDQARSLKFGYPKGLRLALNKHTHIALLAALRRLIVGELAARAELALREPGPRSCTADRAELAGSARRPDTQHKQHVKTTPRRTTIHAHLAANLPLSHSVQSSAPVPE